MISDRRPATGPLLAFDVRSRPGEILLYDPIRGSTRGRLAGVISAGGNFNMEQQRAVARRTTAGGLCPASMMAPSRRRFTSGKSRPAGRSPRLRDCKLPIWSPDGRHLVTIAPGTMASQDGFTGSPEALVKIWEARRSDPHLSPGPADPGDLDVARRPSTGRGRSALAGRLRARAGAPRPAAATGPGRSPRLYRLRGRCTPSLRSRWTPSRIRADRPRSSAARTAPPGAGSLPTVEHIRREATYINDYQRLAFSPDGRFAAVLLRASGVKDKRRHLGSRRRRAGRPLGSGGSSGGFKIPLRRVGKIMTFQPDGRAYRFELEATGSHPVRPECRRQLVFSGRFPARLPSP